MPIGFDKYSIDVQIQVALTMDEYTGIATYDNSKNHMPFTLTGTPPAWAKTTNGLPYLSFNGTTDYMQSPAATSTALNYTSESFSIVMWLYPTVSASDILIQQGRTDVDGWVLYATETVNTISIRTNQGGAHTDIAAVGCYTPAVWQCFGAVRVGAAGKIYVNGMPKEMTFGAGLTDAVSVAGGNKVLVGVDDLESNNHYTGYIGGGECGPRVWDRALTGAEMAAIFESERHWFGV